MTVQCGWPTEREEERGFLQLRRASKGGIGSVLSYWEGLISYFEGVEVQ